MTKGDGDISPYITGRMPVSCFCLESKYPSLVGYLPRPPIIILPFNIATREFIHRGLLDRILFKASLNDELEVLLLVLRIPGLFCTVA
jgi:hypothetical protein